MFLYFREMELSGSNIKFFFIFQETKIPKKFLIVFQDKYNAYSLKAMKSSQFIFDYINLLYYKCHKIIPNRGGSYIDSPYWTKN